MHAFDPGVIAGETRGRIDNINYVDGQPGLVIHPQPNVVPRGAPLIVSGWTIDPVTDGKALAVCMLLDGVRPLDARIGFSRGDIKLEHATDEFVGYRLAVATGDLEPGGHELRAYALSSNGFWYEFATIGFKVYQPAVPGAGTLSRALRMTVQQPTDFAAGKELADGVPIYANRWLLIHGWTFDHAVRGGAATIAAFDDQGRRWTGPSNIERADVASFLGSADARLGFEILIPAAVFGRGRHRLRVTGFDAAGCRYANSVETTFDVRGALRPFPLTARIAPAAPYVAQLRALADSDDDDRDDKDAEPATLFRQLLPTDKVVAVARDTQLVIDGWALDESGNAADEMFIQLSASRHAVPAMRLAAECALRVSADGFADAPPVDDAWFTGTFNTSVLQKRDYELELVVVHPGRRSLSRVSLATLRII